MGANISCPHSCTVHPYGCHDFTVSRVSFHLMTWGLLSHVTFYSQWMVADITQTWVWNVLVQLGSSSSTFATATRTWLMLFLHLYPGLQKHEQEKSRTICYWMLGWYVMHQNLMIQLGKLVATWSLALCKVQTHCQILEPQDNAHVKLLREKWDENSICSLKGVPSAWKENTKKSIKMNIIDIFFKFSKFKMFL